MIRRLIRSRWFFLGVGSFLLVAGILAQVEVRVGGRREGRVEEIASLRRRDDLNLLFILIDTLRADRLSCYGHARPTSPTLDALAESGVRFEQTLAQSSFTKVSMASLWTGLYPVRTGVLRYQHALPSEATLPAEILKEAGFRTAGIWRNGWVAPNFGFHQGFDLYQRPAPGSRPEQPDERNPSAPRLAGSDYDATESAREFLRAVGGERWFLYLHLMDVHQYVYDESSAKFGTSYSDIYDNAIHWVDRNVEALLAELQELDLADRTVVVVASDHGEAFYEHKLEGHARNLYREVTETPFILSLPFRLEPGVVVRSPIENVDVWPTLLDLLGLPPLPDTDGQSRVPLIQQAANGQQAADGTRPRFAHLDRTWGRIGIEPDPIVAVTSGPLRLIHPANRPGASELFDHATDPREQEDIARREPQAVAPLAEHATSYLASPPAPWGKAAEVEVDELNLGQLRALGYVVGKEDEK